MRLEVNDLHFAYEGSARLADGITFSLEPGMFTMLLGPNGCGKSTLFRMLTGELVPQSGEVLLDGAPIRSYPGRKRAACIGAVMQSAPPVLDFTVREYVAMGRGPRISAFAFPSAADQQAVQRAMEIFEVDHLAERACNSLSGGERQRVMLASAWANEPEIFLLDEPTSATDPAHTLLILKRFKEISRKKTVFMISHDLMLSANLADRLLLMRHGKILASGSPSEVLTEENIYRLYDIRVHVIRAGNGQLAILPEWEA